MTSKILGYRYWICEFFPLDSGSEGFHKLIYFDNLEAVNEVLHVLEKHNHLFTAYGIVLDPVWVHEEYHTSTEVMGKSSNLDSWDANGSPVSSIPDKYTMDDLEGRN